MAEAIVVRVAEFRSARGDTVLATLGLGSCVAILLHDPGGGVGGLAHILLPSRSLSRSSDSPGRFPQTALPAMVDDMIGLGAGRRRFVARLVGGASMFQNLVPSGSIQMGDRNVIAVREVLNQLAIPIIAETVGGGQGRSVWFNVGSGAITLQTVGKREPGL